MGLIKGQKEYKDYQLGKRLTMKGAILANCFTCNGAEESAESDCLGSKNCALYAYSPWGRKARKR